ncbi:hypothetical protein [Natrinema ejinorense]|uniref:Uncharacterized protein n=1 Tax=Natrinema ejinorense TaxID=373386 RepID=A0A2A5QPE9_9EURY|nr:hypothetical protein [Natrinema ejinorense]PCR88694.1 hypothetical protein CP557_21945 [Natrinema ejinorense]
MSLLQTPRTGKGVLIALGVVGVVIVWLYATTLLTVVIGATIIAVVLYVLYVLLYRLNRMLRDKRILGGGRR